MTSARPASSSELLGELEVAVVRHPIVSGLEHSVRTGEKILLIDAVAVRVIREALVAGYRVVGRFPHHIGARIVVGPIFRWLPRRTIRDALIRVRIVVRREPHAVGADAVAGSVAGIQAISIALELDPAADLVVGREPHHVQTRPAVTDTAGLIPVAVEL